MFTSDRAIEIARCLNRDGQYSQPGNLNSAHSVQAKQSELPYEDNREELWVVELTHYAGKTRIRTELGWKRFQKSQGLLPLT